MKYPGSQQGNEEFPPIDNRLGSFSSQSETQGKIFQKLILTFQEVEYGVPIQGVQSKTKDVKDAIMDVESPEERKEDVTEIQTNKLVSNPLIHEIEGMNYEVAQMIRRFILVNTSSFMVYCQLAIFAKTNDLLNFRIPVSIFNANIKPKSKSCILCLTKFDPTLPWGEYEVKCHIQLMEAPAEPPKSENDSGKKKGNIFQIRPIDLYNAASNFEYTDEDFYTEFFSK